MRDDLLDVAGGDPHRARLLRDNLAKLADGPDPELREMARAVLKGEIPLRDAALSEAYGTALGQSFDAFWDRYSEMTPEARASLAAGAEDPERHAEGEE